MPIATIVASVVCGSRANLQLLGFGV